MSCVTLLSHERASTRATPPAFVAWVAQMSRSCGAKIQLSQLCARRYATWIDFFTKISVSSRTCGAPNAGFCTTDRSATDLTTQVAVNTMILRYRPQPHFVGSRSQKAQLTCCLCTSPSTTRIPGPTMRPRLNRFDSDFWYIWLFERKWWTAFVSVVYSAL